MEKSTIIVSPIPWLGRNLLFFWRIKSRAASTNCILDQSQAVRAQGLTEEGWFCAVHFYLCSSEKGVDLRLSWSEGHGLCPSEGNVKMFCPKCCSLELWGWIPKHLLAWRWSTLGPSSLSSLAWHKSRLCLQHVFPFKSLSNALFSTFMAADSIAASDSLSHSNCLPHKYISPNLLQ